jgi:ABC-type nitrate/sulfonate/bicarbonate transport system, ATPase component
MIDLSGVSKGFMQKDGRKFGAIENVTFSIRKGEFLSLLGPSGCGKSTLLNLIAGLEQADSGEISMQGKKINGPAPDRTVVFQEHALFPWMTVIDNVAFGLKQKGIPKKTRSEIAMEKLQMVHLTRFAARYPHELSVGMRQRVAIARALSMDPEILLMDEPFAALDEQTRLILHKQLEEITVNTGTTLLFITHNIREAIFLSDRILVMSTRPGRIKREFTVPVARPRDYVDPHLHQLEAAIMETLGEELEKVLKEEIGYEFRIKKNAVPDLAVNHLGNEL